MDSYQMDFISRRMSGLLRHNVDFFTTYKLLTGDERADAAVTMVYFRSHRATRPFFCKISEKLIHEIADADNKGRFVIFTKETEDGPIKYIKVAQGHSGRIEIDDDEAFNSVKPGMGWP